MNIAIIGAGFTGLSAGYQLSKQGHTVTIFEKDSEPGGLAIGYKEKDWDWTFEKHYHHWFTNDKFALNLAREIGQKVIIKTPKTSVFIDSKIYQLDSPLALLKFPKLNHLQKLQMGLALAFFRYNPYWRPLEKFKATKILPSLIGKKAWKLIWEPQLNNKMGNYSDDVSLVFFWTRINKRTTSLAYPAGGFLEFAKKIESKILMQNGKINYNTEISDLMSTDKPSITYKTTNKIMVEKYDKVIITTPSYLFLKIAKQLPESYKLKLTKLNGLGATDLVLRLKNQFMSDGTYWLSICEKNSPILVIVEHTNLIDKSRFNNEHLVYLGNYPRTTDAKFTMEKDELLKFYDPILRKINPDYKKNLIDYELFKAPFAQPIVPVNYSKQIPQMITPLEDVYLANIEMVYPWDRGTNYAIELGEKVSQLIQKNAKA